ncbi:MAG: M48 family metallopeptidase [Planctomycetota bacterium]|jgi:STE24 endopeptidase
MLFEYFLLILAYLAATVAGGEGILPPRFMHGPLCAGAGLILSMGLSWIAARSLEGKMRKWKGDWGKLVNTFGRTIVLHQLALVAIFAGATHSGAWGTWARETFGPGELPGVRESVILIPYVCAWFWGIFAFHRIEGGESSLRSYVAFRARGAMGLLLLLIVAGAAFETVFERGELGVFLQSHPAAEFGAGVAFVTAGILLMPLVLRVLWSTRPLAKGEIRQSLEQFAEKVGFTVKHVRVWETGGVVMLNAAVAGILPSIRTVFFTRGLIESLEAKEVLAVFAHEVGHVKGGHARIGLHLAVGWAGCVLAVDGGALSTGSELWGSALQMVITGAFGLAYVVTSRRLERAADLYAADSMGDVDAVTSTLQRVAVLSGDTRSMRSLTHASVSARIDFLKRATSDPAVRRRFEGSLRRLAWLTGLSMLLGLALAAPRLFS